MIDIHFIVNPISGTGNHRFSEIFLQDYFDEAKYCLIVKSSGYKGHAINLAKESIDQNANIIVACGGDGTINEVASALVGTQIPLGIIPVGSGNGLASNLKIPNTIKEAIDVIKSNVQTAIDVGCINERYFFSNLGFGFSASVIGNYENLQRRTIFSYLRATHKSFKEFHKKKEIAIEVKGMETLENPFLIFISNSNEMGYKVSLTPKASLQDGFLDVVIVPKTSKFKMALFGVLMLIKMHGLVNGVMCLQTKNMVLVRKRGDAFESQIDGELLPIKDQVVSVSLKEKALIVIA